MAQQVTTVKKRDNVMGYSAALGVVALVLAFTASQPVLLAVAAIAAAVFVYAYLK